MTNYNLDDIVLIGFPHTDLQRTSKRPALVLYDSGDQDILVARVTTQQYLTKTDYKILNWEERGLLTESYIGHIAHIITAYCLSGGDFIGANDGEKSCIARQSTYNAIMMVISQVETSFIHHVLPVAEACADTRAQEVCAASH